MAVESLKPQAGVYGVASQSRLDRLDGGVAVIAIPSRCESFARQWDRNGKKDVLRDALSKALGRDVGVRLEVEADDGPTAPQIPATSGRPAPPQTPRSNPPRGSAPQPATIPPPAAQRITTEQQDAIRAQSPLVEALVTKLNAQIVKIEQT